MPEAVLDEVRPALRRASLCDDVDDIDAPVQGEGGAVDDTVLAAVGPGQGARVRLGAYNVMKDQIKFLLEDKLSRGFSCSM